MGWGIDAGVKFNLPSFGAGDNFLVTGAYTQNAVWYSGILDGMWGENGQVNGNGQPMYIADAFFNPLTNTWAKPTAWSVTGLFEHHFTPAFYIDLEGFVRRAQLEQPGRRLLHLRFRLRHRPVRTRGAFAPCDELDHRRGHRLDAGHEPQLRPGVDVSEHALRIVRAASSAPCTMRVRSAQIFVPGAWEGNSSGFAGRFRITRYF